MLASILYDYGRFSVEVKSTLLLGAYEILKAERQVEQAKARLAEVKRKESAKKRSEENKHKYMMGGIVHKYFPECYGFDEQELNRILAAAIKSEQCQRIIEIVKKERTSQSE